MKKVVCLIAVLALTASVFAAEPITITATVDANAKTLTLGYEATGATMPVGFSFIVSATGGEISAVGNADSFFDVFIDFAADDPAAYQAGADPATGVLAGAHPLANTDVKGAATLPAAEVAISAAELANVATIPATGTICVLTYTCDGTTPIAITFAEDTLRGGVVDTAGDAMAVTLPGAVEIPCAPSECLKSTAPEYAAWVSFGKPDCWCFKRQCRGDYQNAQQGVFWVQSNDFTGLKDAFGKIASQMTGTRICADFDHAAQGAFRVQSNDFVILKAYFGKVVAQVPCCDANGDCVLDANDKYNFWKP